MGGLGRWRAHLGLLRHLCPKAQPSAAPESLQLCDLGEHSALHPSGMGNGNSWGDCPTGTPLLRGFPFPELLGVKYSRGDTVHRLGLALWSRPYSACPRGEWLIPFLGGWEVIPPHFCIHLSVSTWPSQDAGFCVAISYLLNKFVCMIAPAQQSWNKDGPMAYFWFVPSSSPSGILRATRRRETREVSTPHGSICTSQHLTSSPSPAIASLPLEITQGLPCKT